ncbi:hypothetical protein N7495_000272 [Penicillium taxi]|uniref:uncharacterized protein n=1 Tax=Penicillium taxi TaxID=168475 RepID=UPI00254583C5|nr:uncharacterized protein N7495_000272 [Penicillium taxi]KAJ5907590.1 hypothetical protein N7495_000272 [Penicillium taxi]
MPDSSSTTDNFDSLKRKKSDDEQASAVATASSLNASLDAGSSDSTDSDNNPPKKKKTDKENSLTKNTKPSAPWPDTFKRLVQIHRALNIVYTFCQARKHFATTFNNLKKSVQAQLGPNREFTVEDVARMKVLIPWAVRFEYVDEASLDVMTDDDGLTKQRVAWTAEELTSGNAAWNHDSGSGTHVLLFEFVGGDLKREVVDPKTGEPLNAYRRLRYEDLKMPVYSQQQMSKLIDKRNAKFSDAVDAFLVRCKDQGVDPWMELEHEKEAFLPKIPEPETIANKGKAPPTIPRERKSVAEIIEEIRAMDWYHSQIVPDGHRVLPAKTPVYDDLTFLLSQDLVNALYNSRGITELYSHQAEAINYLYEGHNVIVSTSTSSGKSLIYQIPMLHELEQDSESRGLYIFPTKALAQDQKRSMMDLLQYMNGLQHSMVETFDGDTPMESRNHIRDQARIIFTNPDMLHITILPQESSWRTFLRNLKFVVVDELHVYNGLFGSHVAFVMRRLRRLCFALGNHHIKFISCSATVANPEEHMKSIFGIDDVKLIDFDGSPSGRKEFLCWNTPFKDPTDPSSGRGDSIAEAARLFCQLILRGVRAIAFCRIRKICEILLQAVRSELKALNHPEIGNMIMGYRGGYSPQDRRRIEKEMFEGQLLGIVATNALELGVDIGSLDAVITLGFPYSISNLRQQSGRAGRRNKDSLSVLVGDRYPTDQHYMRNPDEIFTKPNCELQIDLENELILEGHVQCAANEMAIRPDRDYIYFGKQLFALAATRLVEDNLGFFHCHNRFHPSPSKCVAIRDSEDQKFAVIDATNNRNIVLEEVEASRAFFTIYEGGIFLHQGQSYLVQELNTERYFARVVRVQVEWSTMQRDFTNIDPIELEFMHAVGVDESRAFWGSIQIHSVVYGFFKIDKRGAILDAVEVNNPPITRLTKGMWLDVPTSALNILKSHNLNIAAAIHSAEHAVLSLLPTFVISSPGDVCTECKVAKKELGRRLSAANNLSASERANPAKLLQPPSRQRPARLTFYDAKGGACGSGIAKKAFEFIELLLRRAVARIDDCPCVNPQGCVECVCDDRCKESNLVMSKAGAGVILRCILGWDVDVDNLPWGEEVNVENGGELVGGLETIVPAERVPWKTEESWGTLGKEADEWNYLKESLRIGFVPWKTGDESWRNLRNWADQ